MSAYPSSSSSSYGPPPLGVAILAILIGLVGLLYLLVGLLAGAFHFSHAGLTAPLFTTGWLAVLVLIVIGVVLLVVASGLWHTELWALALSIIVVGLAWISDLLTGDLFGLGSLLLLIVLIYLVAVHGYFH